LGSRTHGSPARRAGLGGAIGIPTGTVTFLFTDIEGSTKLAQQYPDAMPALLARHHEILNQSIQAQNGFVFQIVGDSFAAAFHSASDALHAALEGQRLLQHEAWSPAPIKVRMGINTGAAQLKDDPQGHGVFYEGYATLALTQRIMSVGHGGQILLSQTTYDLLKDKHDDNTELRDMGERRLKDIAKPKHLYQVVVADLLSDFPPLTTLETSNHNLPAQFTSFIGRERELTETRNLLSSTRLLTFIGPGGTGKTRLSLQVAALQVSEFKDGAWLIELAPLADPAYIVSTIASTFNLREVQGVPLMDTVTDYLRGKQLLLVLDNCEHLIDACARLSEQLLHACPNLKILASSREALGIDGETVYRVPSLSLPSAPGGMSEIMRNEATRLFVERAIKANPQFTLTKDNASFVTQICERLDGIPLAIELAAARVKLFTPEQIAARLDDRFKLLTGGSRTALPRQQTLRALIDWSYLTLNETEQHVLRQLAVFSGGWTFEAAEAVVGEMEAMDGLSGLVNKSLVNVEEKDGESRYPAEGSYRYRYLETIRQYAMEKLLESEENRDARTRHLTHFMEVCTRAEEKFSTAERLMWVNRLEVEHDNIRSALSWALESEPQSALQMVCSLAGFWLSRSYMTEGSTWCQAAISRAEALSPAGPNIDQTRALRARAYSALAMLSINHGDHQTGQAAARKGVTLARQVDDPLLLARALHFLGMSSTFLGEITLAFDSLHESESLCRKFGYNNDLAVVLESLAYVTLEIHGEKAAEQLQSYMEESLALSQGSVDPEAAVRTEGILSRLAFYRGDLAEARKHADLMLDLHREMGDQLSVTGHQTAMAHVARQIGHYQEALALYRETLPDWGKMGHRGAVAHQLECFAFIAKAQEQGERAVKLMSAAEALREASNSPMTPQERIEYANEVAGLRAGMDEKIFVSLWAEGRSMTMEQAIEYALSDST
jgi:predicted ATPase/class 3 adenylate cyclase